jgi:hypothetical protein
MRSFHVHDIAALFLLVGVQEISWPISPFAATGKMFKLSGMTEEEGAQSFQRLLDLGEITKVETPQVRGFEITRFDSLRNNLSDLFRREYNTAKQRERREKNKEVA